VFYYYGSESDLVFVRVVKEGKRNTGRKKRDFEGSKCNPFDTG
jgi:hypothetical protein